MVPLKHHSRKASQLVDLQVAKQARVGPEQVLQDARFGSQTSQLAAATGINNEILLKQMLAQGLQPSNIVALKYGPIAEVAWASGRVTTSEYVRAMMPMFTAELFDSPEAVDLFRSWLTTRPSKALWALWEVYVRERRAIHNTATEWDFKLRLYGLAEKVALASGGIMDQGDICPAERLALDRIANAYDRC